MKEVNILRRLAACSEGIQWLKTQPDWQTAWSTCERGDWMLWVIGRNSGEPLSTKRKKLVLVACQCARLALKYIPKDETRPLKAIEMAEAWASGDTSISVEDIRNALAAAYAAAYAATAATAPNAAALAAAYAASAAANAAAYAAYAATAPNAAYAASAAADAAAYAAYAYAAKLQTLRECADIVRKYYPTFEVTE